MSDRSEVIGRGYIAQVRLTKSCRPDHSMSLELHLEASPDSPPPAQRIIFGDLAAPSFCVIGVQDIRSRGLENLHYAVECAEQEVVTFMCESWRLMT